MELNITHQESYSRGQLLLRTFFGVFYIVIPHYFILAFLSLWGSILQFIAFWAVLFTGKYPQGFFNYQVKLLRWVIRVAARLFNLSDGYPSFGLNAEDDKIIFNIKYPEKLSRGLLLLRIFFGWIYILIPHGFMLFFRYIGFYFIQFIAWWAVLFTGKYPAGMFNFMTGTLRWAYRVNVYYSFLTDEYPPFSGKEIAKETISQ